MQWDDVDVSYTGAASLGVVFDFMFLLVELGGAEEVVDGFVVLSNPRLDPEDRQ